MDRQTSNVTIVSCFRRKIWSSSLRWCCTNRRTQSHSVHAPKRRLWFWLFLPGKIRPPDPRSTTFRTEMHWNMCTDCPTLQCNIQRCVGACTYLWNWCECGRLASPTDPILFSNYLWVDNRVDSVGCGIDPKGFWNYGRKKVSIFVLFRSHCHALPFVTRWFGYDFDANRKANRTVTRFGFVRSSRTLNGQCDMSLS